VTENPRLTCREFIDFLASYLDGEIAPGERERFDQHLGVCPACVDYLASYRETIRLSAESASEDDLLDDAPEDLIRAVLAARRR